MKQQGKEVHKVLNIRAIVDDAKCFETVREMRWPEGVRCVHCGADTVARMAGMKPRRSVSAIGVEPVTGISMTSQARSSKGIISYCTFGFSACIHGVEPLQPSDRARAGLNPSDAQRMTHQLRQGVVARKPEGKLAEEVECDEVYVVAGHKGHPAAVKKNGVRGGATA